MIVTCTHSAFPTSPDDPTIACFVNAAFANVKPKQKSTTGCAIVLDGAAIVCRSKMQTKTALSSTEAEFHAAVSTAKIFHCLRSILQELHFAQLKPTLTHEDNQSTMKIFPLFHPN